MSARLSILMVKNSPSFELTKIRHYLDKPYRPLYEAARGSPPELPRLRVWHDEPLGGAISPAPEESAATELPKPASAKSPPPAKSPKGRKRAKSMASPAPGPLIAPPSLASPAPVFPARRKILSLGAAPDEAGESCDLRDILASAVVDQDEDFVAMMSTLKAPSVSTTAVQSATEVLAALHRSFGESEGG
ncbi:hypothetical protein ACFSKM_02490 [Ancylobacter dichloromethanicus]